MDRSLDRASLRSGSRKMKVARSNRHARADGAYCTRVVWRVRVCADHKEVQMTCILPGIINSPARVG